LTSQIFANIYLNEFDRFVRHKFKPLAYMRYGDDFIIITPDQATTLLCQREATIWLKEVLKLTVHKKNDIVLPAKHGLFFLGHKIYPHAPLSVDDAMLKKIARDVNMSNVASYQAMALPRKYTKQLPWLLLD
jgi:hypothetical protein